MELLTFYIPMIFSKFSLFHIIKSQNFFDNRIKNNLFQNPICLIPYSNINRCNNAIQSQQQGLNDNGKSSSSIVNVVQITRMDIFSTKSLENFIINRKLTIAEIPVNWLKMR